MYEQQILFPVIFTVVIAQLRRLKLNCLVVFWVDVLVFRLNRLEFLCYFWSSRTHCGVVRALKVRVLYLLTDAAVDYVFILKMVYIKCGAESKSPE